MSYRPITITVQNNTGLALSETNSLDNGTWDTQPDSTIASQGSNAWTASGSDLKGPKGSVTYAPYDDSFALTITFDHPVGAAKTSVTVNTNNASYSGSVTNDNLQHHDASCTVVLNRN